MQGTKPTQGQAELLMGSIPRVFSLLLFPLEGSGLGSKAQPGQDQRLKLHRVTEENVDSTLLHSHIPQGRGSLLASTATPKAGKEEGTQRKCYHQVEVNVQVEQGKVERHQRL